MDVNLVLLIAAPGSHPSGVVEPELRGPAGPAGCGADGCGADRRGADRRGADRRGPAGAGLRGILACSRWTRALSFTT